MSGCRQAWKMAGFLMHVLRTNKCIESVSVAYVKGQNPAATPESSYPEIISTLLTIVTARDATCAPRVIEVEGTTPAALCYDLCSTDRVDELPTDDRMCMTSLQVAMANALPLLWSLCYDKWPLWSVRLVRDQDAQEFFRAKVPGFQQPQSQSQPQLPTQLERKRQRAEVCSSSHE